MAKEKKSADIILNSSPEGNIKVAVISKMEITAGNQKSKSNGK